MQAPEFFEKLALFYYFSFLDEAKAQSATAKTIKKIRQERVAKNHSKLNFFAADFVRVTNTFMQKSTKEIRPANLTFSSGTIVLPENSNWGPWFEFRKVADDRDFRTLLYAQILNFSESDIAEGLSLPVGTIRYRIGRGLKSLGRICSSGSANA